MLLPRLFQNYTLLPSRFRQLLKMTLHSSVTGWNPLRKFKVVVNFLRCFLTLKFTHVSSLTHYSLCQITFLVNIPPSSERILHFWRLWELTRSSFWYEYHIDEGECGGLVELCWQRKNPVPVIILFTTILTRTDMERKWPFAARGWRLKACAMALHI